MIDSATNERFFESQTSALNPQLKNIVIDLRSFVTFPDLFGYQTRGRPH